MTQTPQEQEWVETIPPKLEPLMANLKRLATLTLENGSPYHSIRIDKDCFHLAGYDAGRLPAWCTSVTTELGWEYQNTTFENTTMWIMFKNPYIFS